MMQSTECSELVEVQSSPISVVVAEELIGVTILDPAKIVKEDVVELLDLAPKDRTLPFPVMEPVESTARFKVNWLAALTEEAMV